MNSTQLLPIQKKLRSQILEMVYLANEGHIPSAFSILEIIYSLYDDVLRIDPKDPKNPDRDFFVLSKGHAGAALYVVLGQKGFFESELLKNYCKWGSKFGGHPDYNKVPGVEVCSGSLGHGVAVAVGMAMGLKIQKSDKKVFALVGDGEMEEGSFWEAMAAAKDFNLNNLVVIGDVNSSQRYSQKPDFAQSLKTLGFETSKVLGHDLQALKTLFKNLVQNEQKNPQFVFASTTKGYGIQRMIGDHGWHRRTPTEIEYKEMLQELSGGAL